MFIINDDKSIYITRGDAARFTVTAELDGVPYEFKPDDVVRFKVFEKKGCDTVVLQKDFYIDSACASVDIELLRGDTKIGDIIHKPKDFWYEVELNPETYPQTIIGYDEDGAKSFRLLPEGKDLEPSEDEEEAGAGVYERMMVLAGEMHGHSVAAKESSIAAVAASEAAVMESAAAMAIAQSVREEADRGAFNGKQGERGVQGDAGRGYDGEKKLTLLAEGNFSTLTPAVVEVPNVFKCETVYIKCNTNDGGIYYGKWNGKFKDNNAGMHSIDDTGLVYLCSTDSTHIEQFDLFLCRGGCSIVERYEDLHQDMIINDLIDADENGSGYITIVATRSWDEGDDYDGHTYSVYIVERESSGEIVSDERLRSVVEEYVGENGGGGSCGCGTPEVKFTDDGDGNVTMEVLYGE